MSRKYTKRSDYWKKFDQPNNNLSDLTSQDNSIEPKFCGANYYSKSSQISRSQPSSGESGARKSNSTFKKSKQNKYSNIREGILPFEPGSSGVSIQDAIELCQKAYANIAIFRNAVDIMSEFANSNIHLEGGTEPARQFIDRWLSKIKIWNLKDQYFREYYRSGNVFLYRVDGKFDKEDLKKISTIYASSLPLGQVPVKYILLNPYDIVVTKTTSFEEGDYKKVLSEYELDRLRKPKTQEDKDFFNALPDKTKKEIKEKRFSREGIYVQLDPTKLNYSFYKKQDYEPFAIPFGFPVLDDINWKLELKKVDQAISRTVENVILLITMGAEPDKGGINPTNLNAMQSLFMNESVGRVLVSDHTTKANFIIPEINKILGPEKYEIVNADIRDALQNVIVGQEKYSNTQVKAQIFLERLKEARNAFIQDFLQPQIKMVCRNMGFRQFPEAKFEDIDIKDEVQLQRIATRLIELGILTPEDGLRTIQSGVYPTIDQLEKNQKEYAEQREQGMYNPLVGGVPSVEPPGAEEDRKINEKLSKEKIKQDAKTKSEQIKQQGEQVGQNQNKVPQEVGRPTGATASYSQRAIQETVYAVESLRSELNKTMKKKIKKRKLNEQQVDSIDKLVQSVVVSSKIEDWQTTGTACIEDFNKISQLNILDEVSEISSAHELADYPSAILFHSKTKK
jgi:hypothetical protein